MRTNGAVAFCKAAQRAPASIRARFQSGARSKMYGEEGAKMIIHVFSEVNSIKSERRNCPPPTHTGLCVLGVGLELQFAPLRVAELIRLLPQQLPLCAAPRIHFCGNSMPLIKTVAIALRREWSSQKMHSPPNYKGNFMSWKTESNYFNKRKAFSIEQRRPGWSNISAHTGSRKKNKIK